jgi:hypothetical protein
MLCIKPIDRPCVRPSNINKAETTQSKKSSGAAAAAFKLSKVIPVTLFFLKA